MGVQDQRRADVVDDLRKQFAVPDCIEDRVQLERERGAVRRVVEDADVDLIGIESDLLVLLVGNALLGEPIDAGCTQPLVDRVAAADAEEADAAPAPAGAARNVPDPASRRFLGGATSRKAPTCATGRSSRG